MIPQSPLPPSDPFAERARQLHRWNWLTLYLPLLVAGLLLVGVMVALGAAALWQGQEGARQTSSGISDLLLIVTCLLPLSLVGFVLAAGTGYALYWRKQRGSLVRSPLLRLFQRGDQLLDQSADKAENAQNKVAGMMIQLKGRLAYIATLLKQLQATTAQLWSALTRHS